MQQRKEQMHTTGTTPPGADFMMNLSKGKRSLRSPGFGLTYSLYRKNIVAFPECPCGNPKQDHSYNLLLPAIY